MNERSVTVKTASGATWKVLHFDAPAFAERLGTDSGPSMFVEVELSVVKMPDGGNKRKMYLVKSNVESFWDEEKHVR